MLLDYFEQVREQSKENRRRFAFVWSLILTGLIVLIWISILFGKSYALRESEKEVAESQGTNPGLELETEDVRDSFDASNNFYSDTGPVDGVFEQDASTGNIPAGTSTPEETDATTVENQESSGGASTSTAPLPVETTGEAPAEPPLWP